MHATSTITPVDCVIHNGVITTKYARSRAISRSCLCNSGLLTQDVNTYEPHFRTKNGDELDEGLSIDIGMVFDCWQFGRPMTCGFWNDSLLVSWTFSLVQSHCSNQPEPGEFRFLYHSVQKQKALVRR